MDRETDRPTFHVYFTQRLVGWSYPLLLLSGHMSREPVHSAGFR